MERRVQSLLRGERDSCSSLVAYQYVQVNNQLKGTSLYWEKGIQLGWLWRVYAVTVYEWLHKWTYPVDYSLIKTVWRPYGASKISTRLLTSPHRWPKTGLTCSILTVCKHGGCIVISHALSHTCITARALKWYALRREFTTCPALAVSLFWI